MMIKKSKSQIKILKILIENKKNLSFFLWFYAVGRQDGKNGSHSTKVLSSKTVDCTAKSG